MDLSPYYRSLTSTVSQPPNLSTVKERVWKSALSCRSVIELELTSDKDEDAVKEELQDAGLIKIKITDKLVHANVPGGHKYIKVVKARFPPIEELNLDNPFFAAYLKSLRQAIGKAENLSPIEKICCKELDHLYDVIQETIRKWTTLSYNKKTWKLIRNELRRVPGLKFKTGTIKNCCGEKEKLILIWNWDGGNPRLSRDDVSKYYWPIFGEAPYLE